MDAFISRQTGIARAAWMNQPEDAVKVIESLKDWCGRAGVDFAEWQKIAREFNLAIAPADRLAVIAAQINLLQIDWPFPSREKWQQSDEQLDHAIQKLGVRIRSIK